jgi:hypothetical protein
MDRKLRQKLQSRIYGGAWRRVRPKVLERDGGRCQLRLKGCTVVATAEGPPAAPVEPTAWGHLPSALSGSASRILCSSR